LIIIETEYPLERHLHMEMGEDSGSALMIMNKLSSYTPCIIEPFDDLEPKDIEHCYQSSL
jgi:hypothetical protein